MNEILRNDQYQKMKEGTFKGHMIGMADCGDKAEAIRIIQSRIESILAKTMTGNSRRECKNLNNLMMDIASNKVFENDQRYTGYYSRMFQSDETLNVQNKRVKKPPTSQTTTKKLSNFLSRLKDSLELVKRIGKKQAMEQLKLQIDETKKNGGKTTNQKISQLKKITHIITTEGNIKIKKKNKKTNASNEQQQNLGTRRKKKTKTPQEQQNKLTKREKGIQASNRPTQEQNTRKKRKRITMPRKSIRTEILPKKKREKKINSNVFKTTEVDSRNITALEYPVEVKKEKTE